MVILALSLAVSASTKAPAIQNPISFEVVAKDSGNAQLLADLNKEANEWAARFVKVHQSEWARLLSNTKVNGEITMPLALPQGVKGRDVQFNRGEFLSGRLSLNKDSADVRNIPFGLVYGDGEWTHDARYRKSNSMEKVLKAYVRKAVDKSMMLALKSQAK